MGNLCASVPKTADNGQVTIQKNGGKQLKKDKKELMSGMDGERVLETPNHSSSNDLKTSQPGLVMTTDISYAGDADQALEEANKAEAERLRVAAE